jgi:hypothetical protein
VYFLSLKCIICVIFLLERSIWWLNINIEKKLFHFISLGDQINLKYQKVDFVTAGGFTERRKTES